MSLFDTQTTEIPADEIVVGKNIANIRTVFDKEALDQLAESIYRDGLMQPLVVMAAEDDDGNEINELIAGERRLRAIRQIQSNEPDFLEDGVPCIMFEGTLHEAKYINAIENVERENIDDVDLSAWIYGRVQEGVTQSDLAARLHRSVSWVNFRMVFHEKAADAVKDAVREGILSFSAAYQLAKNLSQEDQIDWLKKQRRLNDKITVEQATNAGDPDKVKKPSKKARIKMIERADNLADSGNDVGRGISIGLRWAEGLLEDEEMQEMVDFEEQK